MSSFPQAALRPISTTAAPIPGTGGQRPAGALLPLVWHMPPLGHVDYVNDAWRTYTGLSLARCRGDDWQQALHPDDLVRWNMAWEQRERVGQPCELRCRLVRANGSSCWFLCHVEAIRDEADDITGWLGTATASGDGPALAAQEQQEPALPAVVGGTTAFITAAVHDLKNQIGVMRGTAQLMERRIRRGSLLEPERVLTGLAQIQRSASKMHRLIDEFFDLSRLQSGQPVEFNRQPADLVALARGCVAEHAQTTDHALTLSTTVATLIGDWDAARLERVLANLLSNAIKYSAPATAIQVSIGHDGSGRRDIAVVTVQDHGVGIPAHDLPHIFAPFYRGSNVMHQVEGTGVGLFGARAIVEQQGGTLELTSTEGIGTTVAVRLPLTRQATSTPAHAVLRQCS